MNNLYVLFRPLKVFKELKENDKFSTISLLVTLSIMLLSLILNTPIKERVSIVLLSSMDLPSDLLDNMLLIMQKIKYLQILSSELLYFGMLLFYSLVIWVLVYCFKSRIIYKKVLQLIAYTYLIVVIGDIINSGLLYLQGLNNINTQYDTLMFGLNSFTSVSTVGSVCYTILSYINPFQIWFIILLVKGIKTLTGMNYSRSLLISLFFWIISVAIPTISIYLSEIASNRAISTL